MDDMGWFCENELPCKEESWGSCCSNSEGMVFPAESRSSEEDACPGQYKLQLEHDVRNLQNELHVEMQLHAALEGVTGKAAIKLSSLSSLPCEAKELLDSIAALESAVSKLEVELISLHFQLSQERNERRLAEYYLKQSPPSQFSYFSDSVKTVELLSENLNQFISKLDYSPRAVLCTESSLLQCSSNAGHLEEKNSGEQAYCNQYKQSQRSPHLKDRRLTKELSHKGLWGYPNRLSEEMVQCMKNIFICLADSPTSSCASTSAEEACLATSPYGHLSAASLSAGSDPSVSSTMSSVQSPAVELHFSGDVFGEDNVFDPYKVWGKLSWADIGVYSLAVEVSWMSVGKKQLEYAAGALREFRSLVGQLAKVNPTNLSCNEKLAFWINLYNVLLMHAYLAYGVPKSELKLFSLMQKVAYTVGGHSVSAAAIEHVILKMKPPVHRPQTASLLALHKLRMSEEQQKFSVDASDPLVAFALSSGMYSSPAVRVYTPAKVREELHQSLRDYIRASVGVNSKANFLCRKCFTALAKLLLMMPLWLVGFANFFCLNKLLWWKTLCHRGDCICLVVVTVQLCLLILISAIFFFLKPCHEHHSCMPSNFT